MIRKIYNWITRKGFEEDDYEIIDPEDEDPVIPYCSNLLVDISQKNLEVILTENNYLNHIVNMKDILPDKYRKIIAYLKTKFDLNRASIMEY